MRQSQAGFSLIEVLIALTILALSLAAFYQSFSVGAKTSYSAQMRADAAIFVQSLLATKGVSEPLEAGHDSGIGPRGFRWTMDIEEVAPVDESLTKKLSVFDVSVDVMWGGKGEYKVHTLKAQHVADQ